MKKFLALFLFFLTVGFGLVISPFVAPSGEAFTRGVAGCAAALIQMAGGNVQNNWGVLASPSGFSIQVMNGCNGLNAMILLWAAVLAYPAGALYKVKGLAVGSLAVQLANLVRIVSLYYLGQWSAAWFGWMHEYVWEVLIMITGMAVFLAWIRRIPADRQAGDAGAAGV